MIDKQEAINRISGILKQMKVLNKQKDVVKPLIKQEIDVSMEHLIEQALLYSNVLQNKDRA